MQLLLGLNLPFKFSASVVYFYLARQLQKKKKILFRPVSE